MYISIYVHINVSNKLIPSMLTVIIDVYVGRLLMPWVHCYSVLIVLYFVLFLYFIFFLHLLEGVNMNSNDFNMLTAIIDVDVGRLIIIITYTIIMKISSF